MRRKWQPPRIPAWETPRTEEPGRLWSMGSQGLDVTWQLNNNYIIYVYNLYTHIFMYVIYICISEALCCTAEINTL